MIFQTEKQLKEYGEKVPEDKKGPIESALADLKEAHKTQDMDKIDSAMEAMNTAWQAASQDIYKASQEAQANGAAPDAEAGGAEDSESEDVTDVEFEEVEEK